MIESYRFGVVVIAGKRYTKDIIVLPDRVIPNWWRKEGHLLQLDDLREVLAGKPEVLIVGTGEQECMKVAEEVIGHARKAEVELLIFDTRTACQIFNCVAGRRRAAAALHLTC